MIRRRPRYWLKYYPMNFLHKEVHKNAMRRTQEIMAKQGYKITFKDIDRMLLCIYVFMDRVGHKIWKWPYSGGFSQVYTHFGYFRVLFPELIVGMHANGEFTDQEFKVIREELYKPQFDQYYEIMKIKQEKWNKRKQKQ